MTSTPQPQSQTPSSSPFPPSTTVPNSFQSAQYPLPCPSPKTQSLLKTKYDQIQQYLDLQCCAGDWYLVVLGGDWGRLCGLGLSWCEIGDYGVQLLSKLNWPNLHLLNLGWNKISDTGIKYLLDTNLHNLKQLNLSNNNIGKKGCQYLAKIDMPMLEILRISWCKFSDPGCLPLSKSHTPNLTNLCIHKSSLTHFGYFFLTQAYIKNMQKLQLCWLEDKAPPIARLYLVAADYGANCQVCFQVGDGKGKGVDGIGVGVGRVVGGRYRIGR